MQIGQLAQAAGVAIDTVRYYERQGLLPAPPRRGSYRNYQAEDVLRMRFIRRAKGLGFSLEEIAGLLQLSAHRNDDMAGLKQAAQARLSKYQQEKGIVSLDNNRVDVELSRLNDLSGQLVAAQTAAMEATSPSPRVIIILATWVRSSEKSSFSNNFCRSPISNSALGQTMPMAAQSATSFW